jgi:hypothetical protein
MLIVVFVTGPDGVQTFLAHTDADLPEITGLDYQELVISRNSAQRSPPFVSNHYQRFSASTLSLSEFFRCNGEIGEERGATEPNEV